MRKICAWCGKRLDGSRGRGALKISYGICVPCACRLVTDSPEMVKEFNDRMEVTALEKEDAVKPTTKRSTPPPP